MKSKQKFSTIAIFGYFFGITIGAFLFYAKDLLWLPYISITITIVVAFFIFAFATKIISGAENFVLYRHMLFSIACVSVILSLMQIPLLPYLDVYIVGFGFFHLFGRIGCYKAGCCHGRPSVFGVKYNESYRSQGFPEYLINVILFPVQIIEAIGIAFITLYCICLFFADLYVPGSILSWYFILYSSLRFILEFFRGDADRKYWSVFSEAQWISFLLLSFIVIAGTSKLIDMSMLQLSIASLIIICMTIIFFIKKFQPQWQISNAHHLKEIAEILNEVFYERNNPPIAYVTSFGVCISVSVLEKK